MRQASKCASAHNKMDGSQMGADPCVAQQKTKKMLICVQQRPAGVWPWVASPTPCVTFHRVAVSVQGLHSPSFFPPRAASGQCFLTAAAAGGPCGVVTALAEPSTWPYIWAWGHFELPKSPLCMGMGTLCTAKKPPMYVHGDTLPKSPLRWLSWGSLYSFGCPLPLRTQVVNHTPRRVSMCVRPDTFDQGCIGRGGR